MSNSRRTRQRNGAKLTRPRDQWSGHERLTAATPADGSQQGDVTAKRPRRRGSRGRGSASGASRRTSR